MLEIDDPVYGERLFNDGKPVVMPVHCATRPKFAALIVGELLPVSVRGITMDAYHIALSEESRPQQLTDLTASYELHTGVYGDRIVPVLLPKDAQITITSTWKDDEPSASKTARENALSAYRKDLVFLAQVTGFHLKIYLGLETPHDPLPEEPGVKHLTFGVAPPGELRASHRTSAYEIPLERNNQFVHYRQPTPGVGYVLKDTEDMPVLQLVGSTVYTLLPMFNFYYGMASQKIFKHLLATLGNGWRQEARGELSLPERATSEAAFMKVMEPVCLGIVDTWKKAIKEYKEDIQSAQARLQHAYRLIEEYQALLALSEQGGLAVEAAKRLPKDYQGLKDHPEVAQVYMCDKGVHVETKVLIARHDGKRYRLGSFMVRFNEFAGVTVYGHEPLHPQQIPHPHLPRGGTPCYGSATTAVAKAIAQFRLLDCFNLILRWLKDGYTPSTADVKIEEWPLEPEKTRDQTEHVTPAKAVRSKARTTRHADGRGSGRKPRRANAR